MDLNKFKAMKAGVTGRPENPRWEMWVRIFRKVGFSEEEINPTQYITTKAGKKKKKPSIISRFSAKLALHSETELSSIASWCIEKPKSPRGAFINLINKKK